MFRYCLRNTGLMFVAFGMLTIVAPPAAVLLLLGLAMLAVCALGSLFVHLYHGATRVKGALLLATPRVHLPHPRIHLRARHMH